MLPTQAAKRATRDDVSLESLTRILKLDGLRGFEFRVEVMSASVVASPEWRFGDIARSIVQGPAALVRRVYFELQLGEVKFRSKACPLQPEGFPFAFSFNQAALFAYNYELELQIRVYAKRSVQWLLRGHPLIGEGRVKLRPALLADLEPRQVEVSLERSSATAGSLALRYQFMPSGGSATGIPRAISDTAACGKCEQRGSSSSTLSPSLLDEQEDLII